MTKRKATARPLKTTDLLPRYRCAFKAGNTLMAWRALREVGAAGVQVPAWVRDYLDATAWDLLRLNDPNDSQIVAALGLKRTGRGTVFTRERKLMRDHFLAADVARRLGQYNVDGARKAYRAIADVAADWRVKPTVVREAWKRRQH